MRILNRHGEFSIRRSEVVIPGNSPYEKLDKLSRAAAKYHGLSVPGCSTIYDGVQRYYAIGVEERWNEIPAGEVDPFPCWLAYLVHVAGADDEHLPGY